MYYLLDGAKRQLAVYEGIESNQTSCGLTLGNLAYLSASEYLYYGGGTTHNFTIKPINATSSRKEYKVQDMLGSTRVAIEPNGSGGGVITGQYDYAPFGKVMWKNGLEKRLSFIDKEKDEESSLSDFGVRKYDDEIGRFTSIDVLWEKYRGLSPYQYCRNNPLILVDPSGMVFDFSPTSQNPDEQAKAAALVDKAIDYLIQKGACEEANLLIELRDCKDIVVRMDVMKESENLYSGQYMPGTQTIVWHPYTATVNSDGSTQSPALSLLHEGAHALRHATALNNRTKKGVASGEERNFINDGVSGTDSQYGSVEERRVVECVETPAAIGLGEGIRTDHKSAGMFRVSGPDSRTPINNPTKTKRK